MPSQQLTWIGLSVGDYVIDTLLGEGSFSWVYRGLHVDGERYRAFKVAKPPAAVEKAGSGEPFRTEARAFFSGFVAPVRPDACKLLALQVEKLRACPDPALVQIEDLVVEDGLCYAGMQWVQGSTLRQLIAGGEASIVLLAAVARAMARLTRDYAPWWHGDLKPENIICTGEEIRILDPGHFGPLDCLEGEGLSCAVTTPAYYPLLSPDDMLAFGLMQWEVVMGRHPLVSPYEQPSDGEDVLAPDLLDWIRSYENVGQYYLSPLRGLRRPSELQAEIPPKLEAVLLKTLGVAADGRGRLTRAPAYADFSKLASDLEKLRR